MLCRGQWLSLVCFFSRGPWIFKVPVCFQRLESHNFNQSCMERCVKRFQCCNWPSKAVACAEPPTSPLLVFGSGAQKPTLVNDLYLQSTPAVFKITYKSHWNPTPSLCVAHALQQLSFLPGFLEMLNFFPPSPPCLSWLFRLSHVGMQALISSADGAGTAFTGGNVWRWVGGRGANDLCVAPFLQTHVSVPPKSRQKLQIFRL